MRHTVLLRLQWHLSALPAPTGVMRSDGLVPRCCRDAAPIHTVEFRSTRVVADAVHARGAGGIADLTTGAAHLGVGRAYLTRTRRRTRRRHRRRHRRNAGAV